MSTVQNITSMAMNNYLKEIKTNLWPNDKQMFEYFKKKTAEIFETEDGLFVEFENEPIKKDFCFSYGYCGIAGEKEEEAANKVAQLVRESTEYFLQKNLESIDDYISRLNQSEWKLGLFAKYYNKSIKICYVLSEIDRYFESNKGSLIRMMTESERDDLLDVAKRVRERRVKKLNSYLKRYGLSKVKSWAFLSD